MAYGYDYMPVLPCEGCPYAMMDGQYFADPYIAGMSYRPYMEDSDTGKAKETADVNKDSAEGEDMYRQAPFFYQRPFFPRPFFPRPFFPRPFFFPPFFFPFPFFF